MIENPYKRGPVLPPKKPSRLVLPCSIRSIALIFILLLAVVSFFLHGRGGDEQANDDAKGIPAGKLRGARDKGESTKRRKNDLDDRDNKKATKDVVPTRLPVASKRVPATASLRTAKPTVSPVSRKPTARPTAAPSKQHSVHTEKPSALGAASKPKSEQQTVVKQSSSKNSNGQKPPVIISSGTSHSSGEGSRPVQVVSSQSTTEDRSIRGQGQEPEEREATKKKRVEPASASNPVKIVVGRPKTESIRGQEQDVLPETAAEEEQRAGAEGNIPAVRGQRQESEGDVEGDALRAQLLAEEAEAAAEAGKEVVHSREQLQEETGRGGGGGGGSEKKESTEQSEASRAEVAEIRAHREASLTHAQLREEHQGGHKEATSPKGGPVSRVAKESEAQETTGAAPAQPPKAATSDASSSSASGSTKSKISTATTKGKSKPKQPKPKAFKPVNILSPEAAKLAAAKTAVALVDPMDLVDIDNMTPVEVADGGNHQENTLGPQLGVGAGMAVDPGVIDCSGSTDPFPGQAVETFEPPVLADLKDKMAWGDAVRDMLARIRQMKMGGDPLRKAIREEVNTLVVLRAKLFCAAAAAAATARKSLPQAQAQVQSAASDGSSESEQQSKAGS